MRLLPEIRAVAVIGLLSVVAVGLSPRAVAAAEQSTAAATQSVARIVASAQEFLATLDDAGRGKVVFPFDSPQKQRWSNLPTGIFERQGARLGDLTPQQRKAAMALLATALSADGYRKAVNIMRSDEALRKAAAERRPASGGVADRIRFGEDEYYLAFVGAPSISEPWILQFGGHHLAINLTLVGARATLAPTHTATQPATFTFEGETIRPLGKETDQAFALVATLDAKQLEQAILDYRVSDLVLGPGQDGRTIAPEGLRASALSPSQQRMLLDIIGEWVNIANDAHAAARMDEIRANLPQTLFAWSGPTTPGSVAYFRIHGPTLVIEYAPQRGVDHIHTIYRDPTNDYGAAYLRK